MAANSPNNVGLGAALDLGLGDMLGQQVANETEEQKRKRMTEMRNGLMNSPAAVSLLGGYGGSGT